MRCLVLIKVKYNINGYSIYNGHIINNVLKNFKGKE